MTIETKVNEGLEDKQKAQCLQDQFQATLMGQFNENRC